MVMGPETKHDCAGEGQQQFTGHTPKDSVGFLRFLAYCPYFEKIKVGL
jgi:hypothetical protein